MMVRKQNVPFPVTAAEKLEEAAYFYNLMLTNHQNTRAVPFLFSAFLTALKSTVDFLLRQHNSHPGFKGWFQAQMGRKSGDPVMSSLHELRNTTVHRKPIDSVSFESGPRFATEYVETTHFEAENWTDEQGNERWKYRIGPDAPWLDHGTNIRWYLETPEEEFDLFTACRYGLEFVNSLISDWLRIEASSR